MIQRVQSVWLLLAAIFSVVSVKQPFFTGSVLGQPATLYTGSSDMFILILTIVVAALSFVLIFLYKNRAKQLWLVVFDLLLSLFLIAVYFMKTRSMLGEVSLKGIFVLVIPIFLLFAVRGIARDRKLIKSVDRLRG